MLRIALSFAVAFAPYAAFTQSAYAATPPQTQVCAAPFIEAAPTRLAPPVLPSIAREQRASGAAVIEIRLSPSGAVVGRTVATSSGNRWLDRAALESADGSRFSPEFQDCKAVGGTYLLRVEFPE